MRYYCFLLALCLHLGLKVYMWAGAERVWSRRQLFEMPLRAEQKDNWSSLRITPATFDKLLALVGPQHSKADHHIHGSCLHNNFCVAAPLVERKSLTSMNCRKKFTIYIFTIYNIFSSTWISYLKYSKLNTCIIVTAPAELEAVPCANWSHWNVEDGDYIVSRWTEFVKNGQVWTLHHTSHIPIP